jgi:signal transduction histidine kinase/PAS domain-containing protein
MRSSTRQFLWRLLPAVCFASAVLAWLWLYVRFLRSFYSTPNPFLIPLSLMQWLPAFIAAILALARVRLEKGSKAWAWFFLGLALTLWPLADGLETLIPSNHFALLVAVPRLVHLLAYGFALTSIFFFAPLPEVRFGRLRFLIDMIIHSAAWGMILWFLLVEPILQPIRVSLDMRFWIALYSIADLVLLMLVVWLQGQLSRPPKALWLIAGGFFLLSVHDVTTGWMVLQGAEQAYVFTGFLMVGGYILIGIASTTWSTRISEPEHGSAPGAARRRIDQLRARMRGIEERWLPLASTIALIVFLLADWNRSGAVDPLLAVSTACLSLLLILREGVIAGAAQLEGYAVLLENIEDPAFICNDAGRVILENPALRGKYPAGSKEKLLPNLLPVRPGWDYLLGEAGNGGWGGEVWVGGEPSGEGGFPAWLVLQRLSGEQSPRGRFAGLLHDLSPQRRQEESLRAAYHQAEESRVALEELSGALEGRVREKTADLSKALSQLEEQNRMLRELDRLKSEFVALTSHELRTPLMAIRGGLELIAAQKNPLPPEIRSNLELVRKESERLGRFVESILDLSALEAGRLPLQLGPVQLKEPVEEARMALAASHGGLEGRNLKRLAIRLPARLPDVQADEHILASVLFQLIDNAFKYAPEGPVRLTARERDGGVDVILADSGPGIPPEKQDQLFQLFSRLEDADSPRVRGVGLGLYISRKMVEAMGGSIELRPAERGLALCLRLPVFPEAT